MNKTKSKTNERKFAPLVKAIKGNMSALEYHAFVTRWGRTWYRITSCRVGDPYMPTRRNYQQLCSLAGIPPEMAINHPETEKQ